jgi:26S proteasome regulatory subunit N1
MAKDEQPKSIDKGKGKAIDGEPSKAEDIKKDKDGKPIVNGEADGIIGGKTYELQPSM